MFDFKIGQKVIFKDEYSRFYGVIAEINNDEDYPIIVDFCNNSQSFTHEGRYNKKHKFASLLPFRGTPESRRIVAMLANKCRKHRKTHARIDPYCDDMGDLQSAASLEHHFKQMYLKAKQLLNEE